MSRNAYPGHTDRSLTDAAARIVMAAALGASCLGAFAQEHVIAARAAPLAGDPDGTEHRAEVALQADPTIGELKALYLRCSDAALQGRLASAEIGQCSIVYEELKRRAFDGDFDRLLAWSRAQAAMRTAQRAR